jgi:hypothetical protein
MKVICEITYLSGEIYVGKDLTGSINYFGSASSKLIEMDFTPNLIKNIFVKNEIL